jgi:hypothetical protein
MSLNLPTETFVVVAAAFLACGTDGFTPVTVPEDFAFLDPFTLPTR